MGRAVVTKTEAEEIAARIPPCLRGCEGVCEHTRVKNKGSSKFWIQTRGGRAFDLGHPRVEDVDPRDVAYALARICRFTGHVEHYSVAEHSVFVSRLADLYLPGAAAWGLLHDAAEAYVGDVSYPVKLFLRWQDNVAYDELEASVERVVMDRFGVHPTDEVRRAVKDADLVLLATEARDLFHRARPREWEILRGVEPLAARIAPRGAFSAEDSFLDRGRELGLWDAP